MTRRLLQLFWEMFKIAFTVVGGGFAILAVADEVFSRKLKWTEEGEIVRHLPVFQMVPGIIAGGTAIYIGRKMAGVPGALAALTGVFLPSVIVFSAVSAGYALIPLESPWLGAAFLGLRAALTGIIAAMVAKAWPKSVDSAHAYFVLAAALAAIGPFGQNPALVVIAAALLGVAVKVAARPGGGTGSKRVLKSSLWAVPLIFLKYGSIAFGGGYVLVPVYIGDFVGKAAPYLQLAEREFADVMALTQMTPGPIAVNCATFFGYRMGAGDWGSAWAAVAYAFVATLSLLVPGAVLLYLALGSLERFRTSRIVQGVLFGVKPVTVAMMMNALWAFAGMSVWTRGGAGEVIWHPATGVLAVSTAIAMYAKRLGAVKLIFLCAGVSVAVDFLARAF